MELTVRSIDEVFTRAASPAADGGAAPPNLSFDVQGRFAFSLKPGTFIDREGTNGAAVARLQASGQKTHGLPVGICELRDVHVLAPHGLIIDFNNRICWKGSLLNWTDHVFHRHTKSFFGPHRGKSVLAINFPEPDAFSSIDAAVLIAAPGFGTYGHWLIDFLPRIDRAAESGFGHHPIYRRARKPWAGKLADVFAPGKLSSSDTIWDKLVRIERLILPTTIRAYGIIEEQAAARTWNKLNQILGSEMKTLPASKYPDKLFVSRRNWAVKKGKRVLENAMWLERRLEAAGFTAVFPETLSIAEQRHVFAEARVVVGEDGSGMHNTIYCRSGTRIGIIAMDRINTNHAMTANVLGHQMTYIGSEVAQSKDESSLRCRVRPSDIDAAMDKLLGGV